MNFEMPVDQEKERFLQWAKEQITDYEELFDLSRDVLNNKKILDVGAGNRRFAITCILNGLNSEVYSLEPGLDGLAPDVESSYASKEFLNNIIDRVPQDIKIKVDEKTIIAPAEKIPVPDNTFDLVIGRSVPFESEEQLVERFRELLRVSKHIRVYPVVEETRAFYDNALAILSKEIPISVEYKNTLETDVRMETGMVHIREDVLIVKTIPIYEI